MSVSPASPVIDMRSDTVSRPTAAMRTAMANAEVGDDVFGDDPTVNELQKQVAKLLGKEAGLFVPSGTMGNLLCILTHVTARGGEMILGDQSHISYYEQGNASQFGGVVSRHVKNQLDGTMLLEDLEHAIRPVGDDHLPLTQLLCLENTHNRMGGRILTTEYVNTVGELAKKHKLALHMDGARLLNATVGLGVDPAVAVAACDSVSLCLSKGLGAPIGSVIVGTSDFIRRARRLRKALGGGLRQVGILAAAGLIAVNEMVKGLAGDHARVLKIAEGLRTIPGFIVPAAETVQTNILYVKLDQSKFPCTAAEFTAGLRAAGLLISATDTHTVRFVTYHQIDDEAVQRTLVIMQEVAGRMTNKQ